MDISIEYRCMYVRVIRLLSKCSIFENSVAGTALKNLLEICSYVSLGLTEVFRYHGVTGLTRQD